MARLFAAASLLQLALLLPALLLLSTATAAAASPLQSVLDLGGAGWTVHSSNRSVSCAATVPGVVHTDLLAAGLIPEPFAEFNELALRWVALENWTYARRFSVLDSKASTHTHLIFEGIDTYANISLNGHHLGTAENAFLRWQKAVPPGLLRLGVDANELVVSFTNPQAVGQSAAAAFPIPLHEFRANRYSYGGRPFVRKSQTHFGWNWGPGYITQGIYRGVRLSTVAQSAGSIDSVLIQQTAGHAVASAEDGSSDSSSHAAAAAAWPPMPQPPPTTIHVTIDVEVRCAPSTTTSNLQVKATLPGGLSAVGATACPADVSASKLVSVPLSIAVPVVPEPPTDTTAAGTLSLWYPNGYGTQALHNLTVLVSLAVGETAILLHPPLLPC